MAYGYSLEGDLCKWYETSLSHPYNKISPSFKLKVFSSSGDVVLFLQVTLGETNPPDDVTRRSVSARSREPQFVHALHKLEPWEAS